MARTISLQSDLGAQLRFVRLQATEALGQPFRYEVEALCATLAPDLPALLGTPLTVSVAYDGGERHFHGIVAAVEQGSGGLIDNLVQVPLLFTLVPKLWLLGQRVDCRIHMDVSVPDLARQLLSEIGYSDVRLNLSARYPKREYCVQYNESGLDFLARLFEQEGIYYYFEHGPGKHTLVLADGLGAHARHAPYESLPWRGEGAAQGEHIASMTQWRQRRAVHPTRYQLDEYDPLKPRASLMGEDALKGDGLHAVAGLESYHWHGAHPVQADGQRYAQVRAEAHNAERACFQGQTNALGLAVGHLFKLSGCPQTGWDQEYLVTTARTELSQADANAGAGPVLSSSVEVLESRLPYRCVARTSRPRIAGLQSAVVAGDRDEDIAVDQHGRVKVNFHWAKPARKNGKVSCPVRVASAWAGKGWGLQAIPRVGQEVLVAFLDGDPDRPLIVGSVYNADHVPPYALPDQRTRSGIRSRSHPDGGAEDFNEICFEDRKGSEDFLLHAQKDMHVEVENDQMVLVEHDQQIDVRHDQRYTIDNDQTGKVKHDRRVEVDNEDVLKVGANATTTVQNKFKLDAGSEIELVTGASSIVMKSSGEITIKGVKIIIEGSQSVSAEGKVQVNVKAGATMDIGAGASLKMHSDAMLQVQAGAQGEVKAPMLSLSADALAKVAGPLILIG
ncbi:type VI secretion system tip protein TssI/VgrG [Stenotrophomonas sp. SY1]|uniref:type VI secretion system Vgr family protein n=1 Tax=Stenotrophomonas sp. SY1 TaxID=477235 RepID=UPI001E334D4F|nr:type VI secretion system tip protein TssI/VgrG [Stenotrophomonas sp. SY1]MCD9087844.1 type VI secretion system tip protein VgrG [Stenotrophomonas sp. SY1]